VCVADTPVCYQVEGSREALRVTLSLDSCHFSELPSRLQNGGSLKLHTVLFTRGRSPNGRAEGPRTERRNVGHPVLGRETQGRETQGLRGHPERHPGEGDG